MGTVAVLGAVRACEGIESVLVVTSDKTYAHPERGAARGRPARRCRSYSASKAGAEIVAAAYRASYFEQGPRLATARAGNVIRRRRLSEDRLVPDIVRASERGEPLVLRYPEAVRPWRIRRRRACRLPGDRRSAGARACGSNRLEPRTVGDAHHERRASWRTGSSRSTITRLDIRIERDAGPRIRLPLARSSRAQGEQQVGVPATTPARRWQPARAGTGVA